MRTIPLPPPLTTPTGEAPRPRRLTAADPDSARILSRADSEALFKRIVALTTDGGDTAVTIRSTWTANLRWSRNRPTTSGDTVEQSAVITRQRNGASATGEIAKLDAESLTQAVRRLERQLTEEPDQPVDLLPAQQYVTPPIWSDATYGLTPKQLSQIGRQSVDPVVDAKLDAAGYVEASAASWAIFNTRGLQAYSAATGALYSETVRNEEGTASGWAGKTHMDWSRLGATDLSTIALRKCLDSVNPVAIEPGRYTAILEPDVVSRMFSFAVEAMDRSEAEEQETVYTLRRGVSKIGQPVLDARITISSDPMDPECGYMPFDPEGNPYRPVTWVENGVLKALAYNRGYARRKLHTDEALPNPQSFRVTGGDNTSIEEMIKTTERGILVTNTSGLQVEDQRRLILSAVTRNGLWLIEHGKISHPIKNLWINESPMYVFNKILQIGPAVRVYGAERQGWGGRLRDLPARALNDGRVPIVAPAMKVQDFHFTRLTDAI